MELDIKTTISSEEAGEHTIKGQPLISLINKESFVGTLLLLWRGDTGREAEQKLLNAMLVACVEHGAAAPSIFVPRVVASTGNDMNASLAASALTVNKKHGGAIEAAARMLQQGVSAKEIVEERLSQKKVIPGLGHKIYKDEDPRATAIKMLASELGFKGEYISKMYAIENEFKAAKGKHLPVNIDGVLAACMLELNLDPAYGMALFIIPRLVGAAAHIVEETGQGGSYKRLKRKEKTRNS